MYGCSPSDSVNGPIVNPSDFQKEKESGIYRQNFRQQQVYGKEKAYGDLDLNRISHLTLDETYRVHLMPFMLTGK